MFWGYIYFNLCSTPLIFESLFVIIATCFFPDMFSSKMIPKELKCETTSISLTLMENCIGFSWRRLWKSIHFVFSTFNDNLFTLTSHVLTLSSSLLISICLLCTGKFSRFFWFFFNRRILLHGKNSQKRDNIKRKITKQQTT